MSRHVQSPTSEGPATASVPDSTRSAETVHPPALPDRQRGHAPPTVRVISASEGAERKAEIDPAIASPDARRRAAERFERARADHAEACNRLGVATRADAAAQRRADAALAAYEEARNEARRTTVALRQRQRDASGTKMDVRRAMEWLARLETLDEHPGVDGPDVIDLRTPVVEPDPSAADPATDAPDDVGSAPSPGAAALVDVRLILAAESNGHAP